MPSKNVLNLYSGLAADAENNKDAWIEPATEEVTYEDGMTEEVFAFDVLVPVIDEEFDLALIGKKNVWYDHKVMISDPVPYTEEILEKNEDDWRAWHLTKFFKNKILLANVSKVCADLFTKHTLL